MDSQRLQRHREHQNCLAGEKIVRKAMIEELEKDDLPVEPGVLSSTEMSEIEEEVKKMTVHEINKKDKNAKNMMNYAIEFGNPQLVQLLLKYGGNPKSTDNKLVFDIKTGTSSYKDVPIIQIARENRFYMIVELLENAGARD